MKKHFYSLFASILLVAMATYLQWLMRPYIGTNTYLLYYPTIAFAYFVDEGLSTTALSFLAANYFFGAVPCQFHFLWPYDFFRTAVFLTNSSLLVIGIRSLKKSQRLANYLRHQNELILTSAGEGIFGLDLEGRTTFCNPAAANMMKRAPEEIIGQLQHDLLHHTRINGEPYPKEECPIYHALRDGHVHHVETEVFWKKDGTCFPVEYTSTPIIENKKIVGAVVVFRDITDRKKSEENQRIAQKAVEELARRKIQFLNIAAHELRNPITILDLLLQSVARQNRRDQPVADNILNRFQGPVHRLMRLVADLTEVSQLDQGHLIISPTKTNLVKLVSECMDEFTLKSPDRLFRLSSFSDTLIVEIDPVRIYQVLTNLLDNAVQYTDENPIEIIIEKHDHRVRVSVQDHGPGISNEQQTMLFTSFSRGTSDASLRSSGFGLGLSVSYGIVSLHGGFMGYQKETDNGSTFYFELPIS